MELKPPVHDRFATHDVTNQPPPLAPYHAWATDLPLQQVLVREGAAWATQTVVVLCNYGTLPPSMPFAALIARAY